MKLILFAFAATAFSGSSRAKEEVQNPSTPENPVPKPTSQPEPKPITAPSTPEPAMELSEKEKKQPLQALETLKNNVYNELRKLRPLKQKAEEAKIAFELATKDAENAEKKVEDNLKSCMVLRDLDDERSKDRLKETEQILENEKIKKDEALKTKKDSETNLIKATTAYNDVFDNMLAEEIKFNLKAPLLVEAAKENVENANKNVEKAEKDEKDSEDALRQAVEFRKNLLDFNAKNPPAPERKESMEKYEEKAHTKVQKAGEEVARKVEALKTAKAKAAEASITATKLGALKTEVADYVKSVLRIQRHKRY